MGDEGPAPRSGDVLQTMWEQTHQQLQLSRGLEAHLQDMLSASKHLTGQIAEALEGLSSPQKRCASHLLAMQQRSPKLMRVEQRALSAAGPPGGIAPTAAGGCVAPSGSVPSPTAPGTSMMSDGGLGRRIVTMPATHAAAAAAGGASGADATAVVFAAASAADHSECRIPAVGNRGAVKRGSHQQRGSGGGYSTTLSGRLQRSSSAITSAASCPPPSVLTHLLFQQAPPPPPPQYYSSASGAGAGGSFSIAAGGGVAAGVVGSSSGSMSAQQDQQQAGGRHHRLLLHTCRSSGSSICEMLPAAVAAVGPAAAAAAAPASPPLSLAVSGRAGSFTSSGLSGLAAGLGRPLAAASGYPNHGRIGGSQLGMHFHSSSRASSPASPTSPRDPTATAAADVSWHAAALTPQSSFRYPFQQEQRPCVGSPSMPATPGTPPAAVAAICAAVSPGAVAQPLPPDADVMWAPAPAYTPVEAMPQNPNSPAAAAEAFGTYAQEVAAAEVAATAAAVRQQHSFTQQSSLLASATHMLPQQVQQQQQVQSIRRVSRPAADGGGTLAPAGVSGVSSPTAGAAAGAAGTMPGGFTSLAPVAAGAAAAPAAPTTGLAGLEEAGEQHLALMDIGGIGSEIWSLDLDDVDLLGA